MNRRHFLATLPAIYPFKHTRPKPAPDNKKQPVDVLKPAGGIPNFCAHEHWGSIFSMGDAPGGFRADVVPGALPVEKTTLIHLLIDPYMAGNLKNTGDDPWNFRVNNSQIINIFQMAKADPFHALEVIKPALGNHSLTGTFLCIRMGILLCYGYDIMDSSRENTQDINTLISAHYQRLFSWYREIMQKFNFTELIRPVHPEFYTADKNSASARQELAFTHTVLRIDPLLEFWRPSDRKSKLSQAVGIEPVDAASWRQFLQKLFSIAQNSGALGIKQLQAYMRNLDFRMHSDMQVKFKGNLSKKEQIVFGDWIVNECCKLTNELNWPHQIHVGTHNLSKSNPLPLAGMAQNYPNQKMVLLHCWPYTRESGYLAKNYKNVYLDTCWQAILNPDFLRETLQQWLCYVPLSKITMSNDSTSIEMAVGASSISKKILLEELENSHHKLGLNGDGILETATAFMHNNAVEIYKTGKKL